MKFPHDFPWNPPKVLLNTTDSGRTRFNPNLYAEGKVCLSILGTWQGPGWRAVQTIESVLVSIQSLMNAKPYHNEPGHEIERRPGDVKNYNECILHENLRVAVCGQMEAPTCGDVFKPVMDQVFMKKFKFYQQVAQERLKLEGKAMKDPFGAAYGSFRYNNVLTRLNAIKDRLEQEYGKFESPEPTSSSTTTTDQTLIKFSIKQGYVRLPLVGQNKCASGVMFS